MVGEELIPVLGLSAATALGRGMRGFLKRRKASKEKFDAKKFVKSAGAVVGFSLAINLLVQLAGADGNSAEILVGGLAASWGLTDIVEDAYPSKKK